MNKKEIEKIKKQKRKEKQKRKDERKLSGGNKSFDEMIAYVDENGNILDTPPSEEREEVDIENIQVSSPKLEAVEKVPLKGRVEHFNSSKAYGFIKDINSTNKYFFHISNAPADIKERDVVHFELMKGKNGMNAMNITYAKTNNNS